MLPPQLLMCFPRQSSLKLAVSVDVRACTHQSKGLDARNIVKHMHHEDVVGNARH